MIANVNSRSKFKKEIEISHPLQYVRQAVKVQTRMEWRVYSPNSERAKDKAEHRQ
jgi:hypothetical protein